VLKINRKIRFRPSPWRLDALEVGDLVLAIGNPFGVGQTTTSGYCLGACARILASRISASSSDGRCDKSRNPGGALVNMSGSLLGSTLRSTAAAVARSALGLRIGQHVRAVVNAAKRQRPFQVARRRHFRARDAANRGIVWHEAAGGALISSVILMARRRRPASGRATWCLR
jgi:S1-C subfamily serine protease